MEGLSVISLKEKNSELFEYFVKKFKENFSKENVDIEFVKYFFYMTLYDVHDGLNLTSLNICKVEDFIQKLIERYSNQCEPSTNNLKLWFYFQHSALKQLDFVYIAEKKWNEEMHNLLEGILQYPETCNAKQLEELLNKVEIFIITIYGLGCPKNHLLLAQTRQHLNSIWSTDDLKNYILKKKYQRMEYMLRLVSIVAGMLIYNNNDPDDENEHFRNIFADLEAAKKILNKSVETDLKRSLELLQLGRECITNTIQINIKDRRMRCFWPLEKMRSLNQYIALLDNYYRFLKNLQKAIDKAEHFIAVDTKKYKCVLHKINELVIHHPYIARELLFPHLIYLSKLRKALIVYLTHITVISNVKENMDRFVCWQNGIEGYFKDIVNDIKLNAANIKYPIDYSLRDLLFKVKDIPPQMNIVLENLKIFLKEYCTLTMVLTNGFLVPATIQRKIRINSDIHFGFANIDNAKFAERNVPEFINSLGHVIFSNAHLILLFNLAKQFIEQRGSTQSNENNSRDFCGQTELMLEEKLAVSNRLKTSWNIWDFHKETIHLANIRQYHTHSTQSKLSYGKRNAQNQTYNTRQHKGF